VAKTNTPATRQQAPGPPGQQQIAPNPALTFPALLERSKVEIAKLIHEPEMVERFARVALTEFRKNADLANCTPQSIMASVMEAARLKLEIGGSLRQGYLVPYDRVCQFQPSYIGLLELARRSGEFRDIDAILVGSNDEFRYERDSDQGGPLQVARPRLLHRPNLWDPGETLGVYVYAILWNGEPKFHSMTKAEVEKARSKSRARNSLMWTEFWGEGAKKTVLRRFLKTQKLSPELADALALDNQEFDLDAPARVGARLPTRRGVAGLRQQLELDEPALPPSPSRVYSEADDMAPDPGDAADGPGGEDLSGEGAGDDAREG
jgi:recombination protein RecT